MQHHLRKITKRAISIGIILVALLYCFLGGCSSCQKEKFTPAQGFSVNFIDVGNGDCIFIRFDDGKNLLIDCGLDTKENFENLSMVLEAYNTTKIDYLILTHPDVDHVGNVKNLVDNYEIKKAFIPNVLNKEVYQSFLTAYNCLVNEGTEISYSSIYQSIVGYNYFLCFLSPCMQGVGDYYGYFNGIDSPTESQINNLSPIVYLEYKGARFIFTGDAGIEQENLVLDNYRNGLYSLIHDKDINLYDVDLLKVAHHGSPDSSSYSFLNLLRPKKAVISVSGNNVYGHPSAQVINNLYSVNEKVQILRTDVLGNITISVDFNGNLKVVSN